MSENMPYIPITGISDDQFEALWQFVERWDAPVRIGCGEGELIGMSSGYYKARFGDLAVPTEMETDSKVDVSIQVDTALYEEVCKFCEEQGYTMDDLIGQFFHWCATYPDVFKAWIAESQREVSHEEIQ